MATADTQVFDYAPAPESRAVVDIHPTYGLFIGGDWADPADGTTMRTISPATEEVLSEVTSAGPEDVDRAVRAARTAFDSGPWRRMTASERGKVIWKIGDLILENHAYTLKEPIGVVGQIIPWNFPLWRHGSSGPCSPSAARSCSSRPSRRRSRRCASAS
jgi:acyl-CoA reductase-like NAD-dependent aldehyde dehydrogenase